MPPSQRTSLDLPRCTGVAEQSAAAKYPVPRKGHRPDAKVLSIIAKAIAAKVLAAALMRPALTASSAKHCLVVVLFPKTCHCLTLN